MPEETPKHPKVETPVVEKVNTPAPELSMAQVFKMLLDQQKETARAYEKLSEALLESRKPYVDPAVIKAKQLELEERRRQVALEWRKRQATKQQCLHRRTNSDGSYHEKYNIKWQEHSNGIILGVCGTCFSQFDARNPKDREFLVKDGGAYKKMGHARGVAAS